MAFDRTRSVPLVAPKASELFLIDLDTFRKPERLREMNALVDSIKDRARHLERYHLVDSCRRVAAALGDCWYSQSVSHNELLGTVHMCVALGYAAALTEADRFRVRPNRVSEQINAAIGFLCRQIMSAPNEGMDTYGVEGYLWAMRNGYAMRCGYFYFRSGGATLPLLVANANV